MKAQLEKRLQELETEYNVGQQRLQELEAETGNVRTAILRISGAIQVLKEELEKADKERIDGEVAPEVK